MLVNVSVGAPVRARRAGVAREAWCVLDWVACGRLAPTRSCRVKWGRSSGVRDAGPAVEAAMTKSSARLGGHAHVPRGPGATTVVEGSSPAYKKPLCSSIVLCRVHSIQQKAKIQEQRLRGVRRRQTSLCCASLASFFRE